MPRSCIQRVPRRRLLMEAAQAVVSGPIWPGTSPRGGGVWWRAAVVGRGGVGRSAPAHFLPSIPPQPDRLRPTPRPGPAARIAHTSTAPALFPPIRIGRDPGAPPIHRPEEPTSRRPQSTALGTNRPCSRPRSQPHRPLHATSLLPSRRWSSMAARFGAQEAAGERGGARSPGPAAGEPRWRWRRAGGEGRRRPAHCGWRDGCLSVRLVGDKKRDGIGSSTLE
jgi:hypothetical protein